jgi:hypothetical protein
MAFERLQALGTSRFQKVTNDLARGIPAMAVARTIQIEWQEFNDVAEKTLTQQLNRLRLQMVDGKLGEKLQEEVQSIAVTPKPKDYNLGLASFNTLDKFMELALIQEDRVIRLVEKEKQMPIPIGALNEVIKDYAMILEKVQKARFDLGIDEFRGPVGSIRAGQTTEVRADGSVVQKKVIEAVGVMEDIFRKRGID